ncbi:MAG: HEPN domain-containing protein [Acidobacteriota bacterium]|nr:HEPN domain-containing protein [Acidobacteriota bacterium]
MPHDPELVAETHAWLAKAALDLRAADHSLTAVPPLVDDIVFHAQQAAEKCFKGFLTPRGARRTVSRHRRQSEGDCRPRGAAHGVRVEVPLSRRSRHAN